MKGSSVVVRSGWWKVYGCVDGVRGGMVVGV